MSAPKIGSLTQSQAATQTPEAENTRLRVIEGGKNAAPNKNTSINKALTTQPNSATQDSLGNPNSPAYEKLTKEKSQQENTSTLPESILGISQKNKEQKDSNKAQSRLQQNWEKLILAQKSICKKAVNKLAILYGPINYLREQKNKMRARKMRGVMMDIDPEDFYQQTKDKNKDKK